ncbi:MAG TPA: hypothetical protein VF329_05535 [Gammaproteobacteria bacterium]
MDETARRSTAPPGFLLIVAFFAPSLHAADPWDIGDDYGGVAMAEEHWTIDEAFPGTKVILDGRYSFRRRTGQPRARACDCGEPLPAAERLRNTIGAHLQWGKGETALEYGILSFAWKASQRNYEPSAEGGFRTLRDTLEWGILNVAKDDPLGIDSYVELNVARASRTWQFAVPSSPWRFTLGINASAGYAWADSFDETYDDVSNMTIGSWGKGTVSRGRWGMIYVEQRVVNGWTFSSPSAGGTVQREARARAGYTNRLRGCLDIEVFAEKRSFNFTDPRLTDLYTKSKRVGVALSCALTR